MLIENYLTNPENSYIYLERYVNEGSPSGFSNISTSQDTAPTSEVFDFDVYEIKMVPEVLYQNIGVNNLINLACNTILVHPDLIDELVISDNNSEVINRIKVFPTASGRTVKVSGQDYFIKLTYNKLLGRTDRQIAKKHILAGLEISEEISSVIDNSRLNQKTALLREVFGRVAFLPERNNTFYEWGFVIREYKPYPFIEDEFLLPCFSLFSKDIHAPQDLPILIQLFQKQDKDAGTFILEDLIFPIYDSFFQILTTCGIGLEAHAQNMLVTIDKNFSIKRIVIRDLESAYRDIPLREHLGVNFYVEPTGYKIMNASDYNYPIMPSFMFDFKLGEYLITKLLDCLNNYYPIDLNNLSKKIQEYNQQYIELLPPNYFPKNWFDYGNEIFETNSKRPYRPHENPKYRSSK